MSSVRIIIADIINMDTDCIVNAANRHLMTGSGVCGAIFRAAGERELQDACDKIGSCPTGSAVITPGFKLKAKYVIHAVGPVWAGGGEDEPELLYSCYQSSLNKAKEAGCHSIAFPLISSGIFGYPKDKAWVQALSSCHEWIEDNPEYEMDIVFTVLNEGMLNLGKSVLARYE